jgi:hypothetical protein
MKREKGQWWRVEMRSERPKKQDEEKTLELDSLVQRKLLLLSRYLLLTEQLKESFGKKEMDSVLTLLARRQRCAEEVERNDTLLRNAAQAHPGKASLAPYAVKLKGVLSRIEALDKDLIAGMKEETATLKEGLLKMRSARVVTNTYRGHGAQIPRFVDVDG